MTKNTRETASSLFRIAIEGEYTKHISFERRKRGKTKIDFLNNSPIDRNDSCETRKVRILELISLCRFCQYNITLYNRVRRFNHINDDLGDFLPVDRQPVCFEETKPEMMPKRS